MRDRLDQIWSQLSYYVDEVAIRVGLARDDPAVDLRMRGIAAIAVCIFMAVCGGWWYTTHVLVTWQPESTRTSETAPIPVSSSGPHANEPLSNSVPSSEASDTPECDPDYSPCVPVVSGDLNCADIGQTVRIVGTDHYHLDNDSDGYGCDSYSN
ncbi:hypothetical protein GII36_02180 [Candidatus Mycosynbacter amalyticus]|uniref:Excalibur calcium-binding domain-containing protein n=1 Tax=Candidatus Mycosynbacter amalyticus TaxID=2665156 RepID=A0A857MJB4_9BACT|nr:hypothetical protein [Candidatus Mycosynbacter amalyticus]QHN42656.1 hypothetical protein GII36_02180 [Candidatus Mycosynbacter amalyticus]